MTRILLIRHGSTDLVNVKLCGRLPGISLNSDGLAQANAVGTYLSSGTQLRAIYSSPLERATETANVIARRQNLSPEVTIDERLTEIDFGEWTGLTFDFLQASVEWKRYNASRSLHAPPGGESLTNVQSRAWECLSGISERFPGATIAVVTHADVIRALLVLFLGMPLDHLLRFEVAPASITAVNMGGDYAVVSNVNFPCGHRGLANG
jgi:probable phosphoglycerate mutase